MKLKFAGLVVSFAGIWVLTCYQGASQNESSGAIPAASNPPQVHAMSRALNVASPESQKASVSSKPDCQSDIVGRFAELSSLPDTVLDLIDSFGEEMSERDRQDFQHEVAAAIHQNRQSLLDGRAIYAENDYKIRITFAANPVARMRLDGEMSCIAMRYLPINQQRCFAAALATAGCTDPSCDFGANERVIEITDNQENANGYIAQDFTLALARASREIWVGVFDDGTPAWPSEYLKLLARDQN